MIYFWQLVVAMAVLVLQLLPTFADDIITNVMSAVVSYQYYDSPGEVSNAPVVSPVVSYQFYDALDETTNSAVVSQIVSYQYFDWAGNVVLNSQSSPVVSYYYPSLDTPQLPIISTSRTPTAAELTLTSLFFLPSQLEVYQNGSFVSNVAFVDTNAMTIVLTHGWIPLNPLALNLLPVFTPNGVADWPTKMAALLTAQGVTANIVAWNWESAAKSSLTDPEQAGSKTPTNGLALGQALFTLLGPNYSKPIHFIGHSFGTLVNAYAANYLQGTNFVNEPISPSPWPATNMQMTLFDEAEVGADVDFNFNPTELANLAAGLLGLNNNLLIASPYYHPLPQQFAWADNYVSAFGLLHTQAVNVILTDGFPNNAPDPLSWFNEVGAFHGYPFQWYEQTITDSYVPLMGYKWSFEQGGLFAQAPTNGSLYIQTMDSSALDLALTNWSYGTNLLYHRLGDYGGGLLNSGINLTETPVLITASGFVYGEIIEPLANDTSSFFLSLENQSAGFFLAPTGNPHPLGMSPNDAGNSTNIIPAYAWVQLVIPQNAVSMSFDYTIQGNWQSDSLAAAFNGTNVLSIMGNEIATNVLFSSGSIDVSAFRGQTNELFIGIVGGTSTNAQLTLENVAFSVSTSPVLQAQMSDGNLVLSWPLSGQNFSLQTTTNFAVPDSWATLTNIPAIVNLQCTVTNEIWQANRFFRLVNLQ